jgi:predicted MFS family arabinose efflux permease
MVDRGTAPAESGQIRITFAEVLRIRTFAVLYAAETQSIIGDQLARVALSILIYSRTGSTVETAGIYALTYLPAIIGGGVLSGLADRYSRRAVMVTVDIIRALLIATMALPHLSTGVMAILLVIAVFLGPLFISSEVSLIAGIMDGEHYRVAAGLRMITAQVAQVGGFALGGGLVAAIGSRATLGLDALTYLVSAVVVATLARVTPNGRRRAEAEAAGRHRAASTGEPTTLATGLQAIWRDPTLRALLAISWLAGFFIAPEGLAAPYAKALGQGSVGVGILLAAIPLGSVLGAFVALRALGPETRGRAIAPMAVAAGIPLICCAGMPAFPITLLLLFGSGLFAAYELDAVTMFVQLVDTDWRGRAIGILGAGLTAAQGLGLVVFGFVANVLDPGQAIAIAGLTGSLLALILWSPLNRPRRNIETDRQRNEFSS